MLTGWLSHSIRDPRTYTKFDVNDVKETTTLQDTARQYLANNFLNNIIDPEDYEDIVDDLGWQTAKSFFIDTRIPTFTNVRRGLFGEILISLILEEFLNYQVPVKKSHYSIAQNKSQEGIDILAFKTRQGEIQEACFVESKLRTGYDSSVATSGYAELTGQHAAKMPTILPFVLRQLKKTNDELHAPFLKYLKKRIVGRTDDTLRLGIISESSDWSETALNNLEQDLERPDYDITIDLVLINDLRNAIDSVYTEIGVRYE